jgi:predicted peptidase
MRNLQSLAIFLSLQCAASAQSEPQLLRESYLSEVTGKARDYFVYLPNGFATHNKWPVLLFLHGDGERGDGKGELDFVLVHGPLYEAWIQKRDLPFVIIGPQLPMYDRADVPYIKSRTIEDIPKRLAEGVPARPEKFPSEQPMNGSQSQFPDLLPVEGPPSGWNLHARELVGMVDTIVAKYRGDARRIYLTGLSYGGDGVWWMASKYPDRFAAANPIAGYPHPDLIGSIADANIPVWCFAGGRDPVAPVAYFYPGMNRLEELSTADVRFTVEEDMNHDVWRRVYAGEDIYRWMLLQSK